MNRTFFFALSLFSLFLRVRTAVDSTITDSNEKHEQFSHRKLIDSSADARDRVVPDQYIIVLKSDSANIATSLDVRAKFQSLLSRSTGGVGTILYSFYHVFPGGVVSGIPRKSFLSFLNNDEIDYATPNKVVNVTAIQRSPVWNLDRIDQKSYPLSKTYEYNYTGKNVTVFVVDTGIQTTHSEFLVNNVSRVKCVFNAFRGQESCDDLYGHGTHVAGTIGGKTFGVAKDVKLRNVKVLDQSGSGSIAGVVAGLESVIAIKKKSPRSPMVINMSLGSLSNSILNKATNAAVTAGIVVAVAAGNGYGDDACDYSPASAVSAITVGSTEQPDCFDFDDEWDTDDGVVDCDGDFVSSFSSQGRCVDIFAPGSAVKSASIKCKTCAVSYSGTSMASPHVAGVAALYLEMQPIWTPTNVTNAMLRYAAIGAIKNVMDGTPNLFLQVKIPTK